MTKWLLRFLKPERTFDIDIAQKFRNERDSVIGQRDAHLKDLIMMIDECNKVHERMAEWRFVAVLFFLLFKPIFFFKLIFIILDFITYF